MKIVVDIKESLIAQWGTLVITPATPTQNKANPNNNGPIVSLHGFKHVIVPDYPTFHVEVSYDEPKGGKDAEKNENSTDSPTGSGDTGASVPTGESTGGSEADEKGEERAEEVGEEGGEKSSEGVD